MEPYSLRHGGASHDAVTGHRNLAQIKARGRWRVDCTVQRYKWKHASSNESPCPIPRRWPTDRPSKSQFQHRAQSVPAEFQTASCVPRLVRLSPRTDVVGTQADCHSPCPADRSPTLDRSSSRMLDGPYDTGILFVCSKNVMSTLTNVDRLTSAHHVSLVVISPVEPRVPGATFQCPCRKTCCAVELPSVVLKSRGTRVLHSRKTQLCMRRTTFQTSQSSRRHC